MPRRRWGRRNRRGTSDASDTRCGRHDGCAQAMNTEIDLTAYLRQHETGDLLRFITCGSVDDGKSTLIGRLLHDTRGLYDDQLTTLAAASRRHCSQGEALDYAMLVVGLEPEREQCITIDVAYRYFGTELASFFRSARRRVGKEWVSTG